MKRIRIRGKEYEMDSPQTKSANHLRSYVIQKGQQFWIQVGGRHLSGEWVQTHRAAEGDSDAQSLVAQFPGKVKKVKVKTGDRVTDGQDLIVVEAMKMEFAVKAPYAGVVRAVNVHDGQQIELGIRFVDLEKEAK